MDILLIQRVTPEGTFMAQDSPIFINEGANSEISFPLRSFPCSFKIKKLGNLSASFVMCRSSGKIYR